MDEDSLSGYDGMSVRAPSAEFPLYKDGDVIVAAGEFAEKEVAGLNNEFYAGFGYAVAWCIKFIFIPFLVAVSSKVFVDKLLGPQPERQRKKRSQRNRFR
jgi:hypothetical protein